MFILYLKIKSRKLDNLRQIRTVFMSRRQKKLRRVWLFIIATIWMVIILPLSALSAPYAARAAPAGPRGFDGERGEPW